MPSKEKKLNGTQLKEANAKLYAIWEANVTDEELVGMIRGKQLDRTAVGEQCGIDRTQLTKNTDIAPLFKEFETKLRKRGILPELTEQGKAEQKKPTLDKNAINAAKHESRVPYLEQQVIELKAENAALKGKLGRFSELNDVYNDLGEL
jgi:hypothetical protein